MLLLDTHIWFWWVKGDSRLSSRHEQWLTRALGNEIIAISAFSCWEVSMMISRGRVEVSIPPLDWIENALAPSGIQLLPLTPEICVESVQLSEPIHGDPADRIIIATARIHNALLLTEDSKILAYPHVQTL